MFLSSVGQNALDKFLSKSLIVFVMSLILGTFTAGWIVNTMYHLTSADSGFPLLFFSQVSEFLGWHGSASVVDPIATWFADQKRFPVFVTFALASGIFFNLGAAVHMPVHRYSPLFAWLFFVAAVQGSGWVVTLIVCAATTAVIVGPLIIGEITKGGSMNSAEYGTLALLLANIRFGLMQAFFPVVLMVVWAAESYKRDAITSNYQPSGAVNSEGRT